jgi:hypothetical protein
LASGLDWQIGSITPPTVCLCCGSKFDEGQHKRRGPYLKMPYIWVCQWCWEKPYLFFPDKFRGSSEVPKSDTEDQTESKTHKNEGIVRLLINPKRPISARLAVRELNSLHLDLNNPRFRHIECFANESELEKAIWKEPSTKTLYREIEYSQGISNPLMVDANNIVREGNRRLVCLRRLRDKILNGESDVPLFRINEVQCIVLPSSTKEEDIAMHLTSEHVSGKKEWPTVNQAAHVYDLHNKYNLPFIEISRAIGRSESILRITEKAYKTTLAYHRRFPNESEWMSKYSYFYEAFKNRRLQRWISTPGNVERLMDWIQSGAISKGSEVRKLPLLIGDTKFRGKNLTSQQEEADRYLIQLNAYSAQLVQTIARLKRDGYLTGEALEAIRRLYHQLDQYMGSSR